MAEATATARGSAGTLDTAPDSPTRTFKTYEEVAEAVRIDRIRAGVKRKVNDDVVNNVCRLVMELQKWKARGGNGTISSGQLIAAMYDDVSDDFEDKRRKRSSIRNWMACAQRIGAIAYEPLPGKSRGWAYELLPVSELAGYSAQESRRGSSAGRATVL